MPPAACVPYPPDLHAATLVAPRVSWPAECVQAWGGGSSAGHQVCCPQALLTARSSSRWQATRGVPTCARRPPDARSCRSSPPAQAAAEGGRAAPRSPPCAACTSAWPCLPALRFGEGHACSCACVLHASLALGTNCLFVQCPAVQPRPAPHICACCQHGLLPPWPAPAGTTSRTSRRCTASWCSPCCPR